MNTDDETRIVTDVLGALERDGMFEPLSRDTAETQEWRDHDLASLVENRFGVTLDLANLGDASRLDWAVRATDEAGGLGSPHSEYQRPFWLRHDGRRVGTISVATTVLGVSTLRVSSLYLKPYERKCGYARRALDATYAAALGAGLSGISLSTEWSWQATIGFYLRLGAWVRSWKRSLDLIWRRDLPAWHIQVHGAVARFMVGDGDREEPWIVAHCVGDRLEWSESTLDGEDLPFEASGTFALALAVRGFPLITSDEAWRAQLRLGFSDCGGPEGLAFKVRHFEAWDRKHGWITPAPRIPNLDYPDWDALRG